MEPFRAAWPAILDRISRSASFAIGTDFDGTVVPVMDRPEAVVLSDRASRILTRLAARPRTSLAIVSGRSFVDLATRVPIADAILIGNHGLEVRVPGRPLARAYDDSDLGVARAVLDLLTERLPDVPGVEFEDKGPVLAVHYRRVPAERVPHVLDVMNGVAAQLSPLVRVLEGSAIFEFCPGRVFGKGSALLRAWADLGVPNGAVRFYFGNDITDEDVFLALPRGSITVYVGDARVRSAARYVADTPAQVLDALEELDRVVRARDIDSAPDPPPRSDRSPAP